MQLLNESTRSERSALFHRLVPICRLVQCGCMIVWVSMLLAGDGESGAPWVWECVFRVNMCRLRYGMNWDILATGRASLCTTAGCGWLCVETTHSGCWVAEFSEEVVARRGGNNGLVRTTDPIGDFWRGCSVWF